MGLLERVPGRVLVLVLVPLLIFCLVCCVHHLPSTGLRGSLRLQLRSDVPHRAWKRARVEMIAVAEDAERVSELECDTCAHPAALCSAGLPSPSATWCFCRCLPSEAPAAVGTAPVPGSPSPGLLAGTALSTPQLGWLGECVGGMHGGGEGKAGGASGVATCEQFLGTRCARDHLCSSRVGVSGPEPEHAGKSFLHLRSQPPPRSLPPPFIYGTAISFRRGVASSMEWQKGLNENKVFA